ncbi:MAG: TonB-dependent receptor [Chitinivibrionales bacterium]|nr:TonB-dependent receptor [Chitinivibrionales bacterium]MBD3395426.1 TonB-dependent receptor [Chitinivibrionales bacterium]
MLSARYSTAARGALCVLLLGVLTAVFAQEGPPPDTARETPDRQTGMSSSGDMADTPEQAQKQATGDTPPSDTVAGDEEPAVTLDRMVITATRTKRRMSETPASVSVIGKSKIQASAATNVDELLRSETNVSIKRVTGMGEGIPSHIIIRGIPGALASTRTLVLVDGIPSNAAGTPFFFINEVPLDAIERVEIVRGPYSALYGANAFGGVVNMVTTEGDGRPSVKGALETSFPFMAAYYAGKGGLAARENAEKSAAMGYWNAEVLGTGGSERFNYTVSAGYRIIGNYFLQDSALVVGPNGRYLKDIANHDYYDIRYFGKFGTSIGDRVRLKLHTRFFKSDLGFGKTKKVLPDSADVTTRGEKFLIGPTARIVVNDLLELEIGAIYGRLQGEFLNEGPLEKDYDSVVASQWDAFSNDVQLNGRANLRLRSQKITLGVDALINSIVFGAGVGRETGDTIREMGGADTTSVNTGVYVQDEITIGEIAQVVPGVRYDHNTLFGGALSPKLGAAVYPAEWLTLRASGGRAYRAPTLSELYLTIMIDPSYVVQSNPELRPEYVWAFDAGFEVRPGKSVSLGIMGFYNRMTDLVVSDVLLRSLDTETYPPLVKHGNTDLSWSAGAECAAEWQVADWLTLEANYVFQKSEDMTYNVPLDYVPEHSGSASARAKKQLGDRLVLEVGLSEDIVGTRWFLDWANITPNSILETDTSKYEIVFLADGSSRISHEPRAFVPPQRSLPAYWVTNGSIKLHFGEHVWTGVSVLNLFDREYEESGGTFAPGRLFWLGVGGGF